MTPRMVAGKREARAMTPPRWTRKDMTNNDTKKKEESSSTKASEDKEAVEVDFGIGKISFGGLFKGIGDLIDLVGKMEDEGKGGIRREGGFVSPSGKTKAVWGYSIKTAVGGKPTVEPFGNVKETTAGPQVVEEREPIVDVFNEKDHLLVIAELPGVSEENITTEVKGDVLIIKTAEGDRKYSKEVLLSGRVDPSSLTTSYKNGILEIKIKKVSA